MILAVIVTTAIWIRLGAISFIYWRNRAKHESNNINALWRKHQVDELTNVMFAGPFAFVVGWLWYRRNKGLRP